VALLEQFGHVYAAIEDELMVNANDPHLSPLYDAFFHKLHRAEAFQQDVSEGSVNIQ
jgi:heme oxygenase